MKQLPAMTFVCGFCCDEVSSEMGYAAGQLGDGSGSIVAAIRICPSCQGPTLFAAAGQQSPGVAPGNVVPGVPEKLAQLYNEARSSAAAGAFTGAVLLCRKLLMNVAVAEGAKEGESFVSYVQYLAGKGYVPPNGTVWVDYIRKRGNEANHEIALMEQQDAAGLLTFIEMLLRFMYQFPNMVPTT